MRQFLTKVFSEPTGQPSFSRVFGAIALSFMLGWITSILVFLGYLLHHYHVISGSGDLVQIVNGFSSAISDIFKSAAAFILSITGAYGVNKTVTLFGKNPIPDDREHQ